MAKWVCFFLAPILFAVAGAAIATHYCGVGTVALTLATITQIGGILDEV